jgi:ubiquinone/menaquinone biosynthesis C-methylase UbiE
MRQILHGYQLTRVITACAELGIPDLVSTAPKTAEELALATHTKGEYLIRLLRAAVTLEVLSEPSPGMFGLGIHGEYLQSNHPENLKAVATCFAQPWVWQSWGNLTETIRTGTTGIELFSGETFFDYLEARPEAQRIFNSVMASGDQLDDEIANSLNFSDVNCLCDVGGGRGSLLVKICSKWPNLKGIVFDLPSVNAEANALITSRRQENRIKFVSGSFFTTIPNQCDCILLRYILHDWSDNQCKTILNNCFQALPPNGRIIVIDTLVNDNPESALRTRLLDLTMMTQTGGRERTAEEFETLLKGQGFRLTATQPLAARPGMVAMVAVK